MVEKNCEVLLGKSANTEIRYAFDSRSENNHMLLLGISGSGKSTRLECMEDDIIKCGKK